MQINPADWQVIRHIFRDAFSSSFHFTVASINEDGSPHVTPIGSLLLGEEGRGVYFENYPRNLPRNLQRDQRVCIAAVNTSRWPLIWALFRGKASRPIGVRLYGTVGERRAATPEEVDGFLHRVRFFRFFRGHRLLWGNLHTVREVLFHAFEPVRLPPLGSGPWPASGAPT
jgi:hypothetical protein